MSLQARRKYNESAPPKSSKSQIKSKQVSSASDMDQRQNRDTSPTSSVSMFTTVTYLVLKSFDPVKVSTFVKERQRYELEVSEEQYKPSAVTLAPDISCINRNLLKHMAMLGEFDKIAPNKTPEQLFSQKSRRSSKVWSKNHDLAMTHSVLKRL